MWLPKTQKGRAKFLLAACHAWVGGQPYEAESPRRPIA
jgi:hypothetical protein